MSQAGVSLRSGPEQKGRSALLVRDGVGTIALVYLAVLTIGETLVIVADPRWGLIVHVLLMTTLVFQAALSKDEARSRLYLSLSLAPLVRILSLSLPLGEVRLLYWYLLTGIPMIAAAFVTGKMLHLSRAELGLTLTNLPMQIEVAVIGISLGACEYVILRPTPLTHSLTLHGLLVPSLILLVGTGVNEEFLFRGVMQSAMRPGLGWLNIVYVAAVFAVLHLGYKSGLDFVFVFGVGMLFSLVVEQTRSIVGVSLAHGLTNIMLFLIMPNLFG